MTMKKLGIDVPVSVLRVTDDAFIATRAGGLRGTVVSTGSGMIGIRVTRGERSSVETIRMADVYRARRFA